jgi:hypothetical protein
MARDAKVIYQIHGVGVILFAGQTQPALAITADKLRQLHDHAKNAAVAVRDGNANSGEFRETIQELHRELATMLLCLTDTAVKHDLPMKRQYRISGSSEFIDVNP